MLIHLSAIAVLVLCLAALTGWGGLTHRLCGGPERVPWTYRAALGLPTVALIGAPLNLLALAHPAAMDALVVLGLLLFAVPAALRLRARRAEGGTWLPDRADWKAPDLLPRLVIGGTGLFLLWTLLPTGVFNHHDDMHKYLVPPLRMLATGTLGGNPFETTGLYSLGLQSFFHGFILAHFSVLYVNGFDAVLCFLLTGLLLDDLGRRMGAAPAFRTLAALILVAINPQYVNISPVYSGALAAAGLAGAAVLLAERIGSGGPKAAARAAVPVGLFAALLLGLKVSNVPYLTAFLAVLLVLVAPLAGAWARVAAAVGGFLAAGAAFLAPWMQVYETSIFTSIFGNLSLVWMKLTHGIPSRVAPNDPVTGDVLNHAAGGGGAPSFGSAILKVFSTSRIYFGQTPLAYGLVAIGVAAVCGFLAVRLMRGRRTDTPEVRGRLAVVVAVGAAAVAYYLAIPYIYLTGQGVRYVSPLLAVAAVLSWNALAGSGTMREVAASTTRAVVIAACMGMTVGLFARALVDRATEAALARSLVSFRIGPFNVQYHAYAFSDEIVRNTRAAQERIPPGAAVLAWLATPVHLDYARNTLYTIPDPEFTRRYEGLPFDAGPDALVAYLRGRGITHVLWEYKGPGMRSDASLRQDIATGIGVERGRYTLMFKELLTELARRQPVLYDDGRLVVFALEAADDP